MVSPAGKSSGCGELTADDEVGLERTWSAVVAYSGAVGCGYRFVSEQPPQRGHCCGRSGESAKS